MKNSIFEGLWQVSSDYYSSYWHDPGFESSSVTPPASNSSQSTVFEVYPGLAPSAKGGKPGKPTDTSGGDGGDGGGDGSSVLASYTGVDSDDPSGYDVDVTFEGSYWTLEFQAAFTGLVDILEEYFADINSEQTYKYRGYKLEDLSIEASLVNIDGVGGVLGQAGPTVTWTGAGAFNEPMPAAGVIEFDIADSAALLESGHFYDVVLHETFHVMGIGTLWEDHGLLELDGKGEVILYEEIDADGNVDQYAKYTGTFAIDAYNQQYNTVDPITYLKVEADGGGGTALGHFNEETYGSDLMTGYLSGDGTTFQLYEAASLLDLGYELVEGNTLDGFVDAINALIASDDVV